MLSTLTPDIPETKTLLSLNFALAQNHLANIGKKAKLHKRSGINAKKHTAVFIQANKQRKTKSLEHN